MSGINKNGRLATLVTITESPQWQSLRKQIGLHALPWIHQITSSLQPTAHIVPRNHRYHLRTKTILIFLSGIMREGTYSNLQLSISISNNAFFDRMLFLTAQKLGTEQCWINGSILSSNKTMCALQAICHKREGHRTIPKSGRQGVKTFCPNKYNYYCLVSNLCSTAAISHDLIKNHST